jgi:hypothetical protein
MNDNHNITNPKSLDGGPGEQYSWENAAHKSVSQVSRSNWQAHLYAELLQALFKMSRLPEDHELFLTGGASKRAADVLGAIQANTGLAPPRLINEDGDTVLFSWLDADVKNYLCVDEDEIEFEVRKLGTRQHCSETVLSNGLMEVEKILQAVGSIEKNSSKA